MSIISQIEKDVKCATEECEKPVFRDGLCFSHFVEAETAAWDDEDAERRMALEGVGYVFGDRALDGAWWGDSMEEVLI